VREPPLALESVPAIVRAKSPSDPTEPDMVLTVRVAVAPPEVGVFIGGEKVNVLSVGRPDTERVSAGTIPVDPRTSVRVIV
jgi:hypothetical protein